MGEPSFFKNLYMLSGKDYKPTLDELKLIREADDTQLALINAQGTIKTDEGKRALNNRLRGVKS
jgi:hypothetical protein